MRIGNIFWSAVLLTGTLCGREFHVTPAGSDKNPGSAQAPFATIGRAAAAVGPGDTVKIGPGLYREQITFKRSGKKDAPVTFAGTRGPKGEFLTIVEPPGTVLDKWTPAPEIGPGVWKTPLAKRPNLVLMDGAMIAFINRLTMELPQRKELPKELDEELLWDQFGPKCKRLAGLDLLRMPADIKQKHQYFRKRKELFWPVISYVLSGWHNKMVYVRFADGGKPQDHTFTATYGNGFSLSSVSYLHFKDLQLRGSRYQFRLMGASHDNTIENCLLMHGGSRILIEGTVKNTTVKGCILTAGFIRSDLFRLRSAEDMRGGLLYLIFKYIIGTASSDDVGVSDHGTGTKVLDNLILRGLIGVQACGTGVEVAGNVVREMSSIGILTSDKPVGIFHHNLVMNCGIPLRIHHLRHKRAKRLEYHYNNVFVQAPHGGSQIYVHCSSHYKTDDDVNFDKKLNKNGRYEYIYKENPPAPVDAGKFYIYHNTFWGGADKGPSFDVDYLRRRFRMSMPFFVFNNIYKDSYRLNTTSHDLTGPNLLYTFSEDVLEKERRDPAVAKVNKVVPAKDTGSIWNKKDIPGLPDVTLAANSPALEAGVDVSRPFTVNGKKFPAMPGFKPGYFTGKAPAAGAFQKGEDMKRFIDMHRRAEAAVKMLESLKEKGKGK